MESTVIIQKLLKMDGKYPIHLLMLRLLGEFPRCLQAAQATKRPPHFNAGSVMEVSPAWKPSQ